MEATREEEHFSHCCRQILALNPRANCGEHNFVVKELRSHLNVPITSSSSSCKALELSSFGRILYEVEGNEICFCARWSSFYAILIKTPSARLMNGTKVDRAVKLFGIFVFVHRIFATFIGKTFHI
jgi:hypothetical protein